jgi:hypothetical protein
VNAAILLVRVAFNPARMETRSSSSSCVQTVHFGFPPGLEPGLVCPPGCKSGVYVARYFMNLAITPLGVRRGCYKL